MRRFVRPRLAIATLLWAALSAVLLPSCETYYQPPVPSIDNLSGDILPDPTTPIVLRFSHAIVPKTLAVKIAPYVVNELGQLGDEDKDPSTDLNPFFTYDATNGPTGGTADLSPDNTTLTITPSPSLPLAEKLVLLVEPGLADARGRTQKTREPILFGYKFSCKNAGASTLLPPSGIYFFIVNVDKPLATQIRLFADLEVNQSSGEVSASFADAVRNPDPNRCNPPCKATEACQTLPTPACVIPSTKAGTEDEFPDFVVNVAPPAGFSFEAKACVSETNGVVTFASLPTDVVIQQPSVTVQAAELTAAFSVGPDGVLRGTGSLTSPQVYLGPTTGPALGEGSGALFARLIPPDMAPKDVPPPTQ
jgi:hypothetical protein